MRLARAAPAAPIPVALEENQALCEVPEAGCGAGLELAVFARQFPDLAPQVQKSFSEEDEVRRRRNPHLFPVMPDSCRQPGAGNDFSSSFS
jgi:hypothetical protein